CAPTASMGSGRTEGAHTRWRIVPREDCDLFIAAFSGVFLLIGQFGCLVIFQVCFTHILLQDDFRITTRFYQIVHMLVFSIIDEAVIFKSHGYIMFLP